MRRDAVCSLVVSFGFAGCAVGVELGDKPPSGESGIDTSEPSPGLGEDPDGLDEGDLALRVQDLLNESCGGCHGKESEGAGGMNYVTDLAALVNKGKAVRYKPEASLLYARISSEVAPMPPQSAQRPLSADEKSLIREWIEAGAPAPPQDGSCAENEPIALDAEIQEMARDLEFTKQEGRAFIRYLTMTHLYNSGYCADEIERAVHAANKLVNSLSSEAFLTPLAVIGPHKTILRLDLRDYGWHENSRLAEDGFPDVWEAVVAENPFAIAFEGEFVNEMKARTGSAVPFQPLDSMLQVSTRGALYYGILQIPETVAALEGILKVQDPAGSFNERAIVRAGFDESGVSDWNRIIERRQVPIFNGGYYWRSYDFITDAEKGNIFSHPIDFESDGGEIIFSLPNGLQGYLLVDGEGVRIDEGPTQVVKDPKQRDSIVKNAISCMSCHESGIIPKVDEVRAFYDSYKSRFPKEDREQIEELYPLDSGLMNELQSADAAAFVGALGELEVSQEGGEPIVALSLAVEANLDLRRAAAELGVSEQVLAQNLARLSPSLQKLRTGTVSRELFAAEFQAAVCELLPGVQVEPVCTPDPQ